MLTDVARHLRRAVGTGGTVARLGGDEFTVLLDNVGGIDAIGPRVRRIQDAVAQHAPGPSLTASIGVVLGHAARRPDVLLRYADAAMYRAKTAGRGQYTVYDHTLAERLDRRSHIERALGSALDAGEIKAHFQPIVDLETGALVGFEALARWLAADGTRIPPGEFIPIAEETSLIDAITQRILAEACDLLRTGGAATDDLRVHLNLSRTQTRPGTVGDVVHDLDRAGIDPRRIVVELDERAFADADAAVAVCGALTDAGLGIAIDDWLHAGIPSGQLLATGARPVLKLDRRLFADQPRLLRALIEFAHTLEIPLVAEGVETAAERAALLRAGCSRGQGFLYAPAVPLSDAIALARAGTVPRVAEA